MLAAGSSDVHRDLRGAGRAARSLAFPHACGRAKQQLMLALLGQSKSLLPAGCPLWASHCVF